ncbi:MAG: hypothetical protein KBT45_00090 [Bacteroidales bacterium]|nr:hypothetical protein [Candidatus Colimorpha pelethequi]
MKKITLAIISSILLLSASNCNTERSMITRTAFDYLDAMGNYRIEDAEAFSTKQTQEETLKYIEEYIMPDVDSSYLEKNTPAKIEIKGMRMVNDSVVRVAFRKTTPITTQDDTLTLHKEDGQWKAHVLMRAPSFMPSNTESGKALQAKKAKMNPFRQKEAEEAEKEQAEE